MTDTNGKHFSMTSLADVEGETREELVERIRKLEMDFHTERLHHESSKKQIDRLILRERELTAQILGHHPPNYQLTRAEIEALEARNE